MPKHGYGTLISVIILYYKKATKYPHKDHIILAVKTNILYQMVSTLQAANNVVILEELFGAFEYVLLQYFDS